MKQNSLKLIFFIWLLSLPYAALQVRHTVMHKFALTREEDNSRQQEMHYYYQCTNSVGLSRSAQQSILLANFILSFAIPSTVLCITYYKIMNVLTESRTSSTTHLSSQGSVSLCVCACCNTRHYYILRFRLMPEQISYNTVNKISSEQILA